MQAALPLLGSRQCRCQSVCIMCIYINADDGPEVTAGGGVGWQGSLQHQCRTQRERERPVRLILCKLCIHKRSTLATTTHRK